VPGKEADENAEESEGGGDSPQVDEAQLKEWKKELTALKKAGKAEEQGFSERLNVAVDALDEARSATLLLAILRSDMQIILARYVGAHRHQVVTAFENWWDRYRVTLTSIEASRDVAGAEIAEYMEKLGYV
jgi:type I restriction enzyme M protein